MPRSLPADHYSEALAGVARFTLKYKAVVIGAWLGLATVLALVFPELETVVRQQSVDPVPRDVASFQSLDRMGKAFGEVGSATTVVVAMENSSGLTSQVRERYSVMLDKLRADSGQVELVRDLLADPTTARQATSDDGKAWYLPAGIAGTFGSFHQFTDSSGVGSDWPTWHDDHDKCLAKAPPHPNLVRGGGAYPRSQFPTLPAVPGWPLRT